MLGSTIITQALSNIYGDSTPAASAQTRAIKLLEEESLKLQRKRRWWFSRASLTVAVEAGAHLDMTTYGASVAEVDQIFNGDNEIPRLPYSQFPINGTETGVPKAFYDYRDFVSHTVYLYPITDSALSLRVLYQKIFIPGTGFTYEKWDSTYFDICGDYLIAALTVALARELDYPDREAKFSQIAAEKLDDLVGMNFDYSKKDNPFTYRGV